MIVTQMLLILEFTIGGPMNEADVRRIVREELEKLKAPAPKGPLPDHATKLARDIRQIRFDKGLSLRAAAKEAGVNFTSICRIENLKHMPRWDIALKLQKWVDSQQLEPVPTPTDGTHITNGRANWEQGLMAAVISAKKSLQEAEVSGPTKAVIKSWLDTLTSAHPLNFYNKIQNRHDKVPLNNKERK